MTDWCTRVVPYLPTDPISVLVIVGWVGSMAWMVRDVGPGRARVIADRVILGLFGVCIVVGALYVG